MSIDVLDRATALRRRTRDPEVIYICDEVAKLATAPVKNGHEGDPAVDANEPRLCQRCLGTIDRGPGFDKTTYMRKYMREYRANQKAKPAAKRKSGKRKRA